MKKIASLFLIAVILLSLASCGWYSVLNDSGLLDQSETGDDAGENEELLPQNENTDDIALPQDEDDVNEISIPEENEITFTETTVVDNDECSIKITGIDADNFWGFTLDVQLENKSSNKTYMFSVENAAVNGVKSDTWFAEEVAAGKKSNDAITLSDSDLENNWVGDYTDIELTFQVYDSNDWDAAYAAEETVHIYPYGEDKAVQFVREARPDDNIIVDNEFVTVIVTGYENRRIWGYTVNLFFVNKTDKNISIVTDEESINGFMSDPYFADDVSAGNCAFSSMSWFDSDLEDNGITDVEEIEFRLRVYDSDDWFDSDFVNEVITLNP